MKLVEGFGKFWRVTSIAGAKTILKPVHSLLQNKCFPFDLFIVRKQKMQPMMDASYSSPFFPFYVHKITSSMTNLIYTIHQQ